MNILLLPQNIASDLSHKVRALRAAGIDARGLASGGSLIQTTTDVKIFPNVNRQSIRGKIGWFLFYRQMRQWIKWADVLHWFWSFDDLKLDKKLVCQFGKPGVVQWGGSDIRIPDLDFAVNPFYKTAFANGYEYAFYESRERSVRNQQDFADVGFYPLEFVGMERYIDRELFPQRFRIWQSIALAEHEPNYPETSKTKPLLVHSPSAPNAKGTKHVLEAVEYLKTRYDFDFKLVEKYAAPRGLEIMRRCDIYIDQLILGSHGAAAVEAMAFGKPVVCYINPVIGKNYPPELPVFNASPDDIAERLETLVKNADLRRELGIKGRQYVEKYHGDKKAADDLVEIYKRVISLHEARRK